MFVILQSFTFVTTTNRVNKFTMVNTKDFTKRLGKILEYYGLSASSFAEKVGVQRSSISHILSGRNKPSLDFVLKVVKEFEDVELYWLLNGKGTFPEDDKPSPIASEEITKQEERIADLTMSSKNLITAPTSKKIERIVIFINDGTFKEYIK